MTSVLAFVEETALRAELEAALVLYGNTVRFARLDDSVLPAADVIVVDFQRGLELKIERLAHRHRAPLVLLVNDVDDPPLFSRRMMAVWKPLAPRELRLALRSATREARRFGSREEQRFQTSMRCIADAVITADEQSRVTFMNPAAQTLTGYSEAEGLGLSLDTVFPIEGTTSASASASASAGDGAGAGATHVRLVRRDGVACIIEQTAAPIIDDTGKLLGVVVVFRDIGDRLRLEQRLAIADRMSALGTVAAGIAHELNNPLAYALANIELLREEMEPAQTALSADALASWRMALSDASDGVMRAASIVKDLHVFLRNESAPSPVDVNGAVSLAARLTLPLTAGRADVELELQEVPKVLAVEPTLVQVFAGLLTNAAQAIDDASAQKRIHVTSRHEGEDVLVRIEDTGKGMKQEEINRAFEPFFTTRPPGEGLGIGLSFAWTIITQAGGRIALDSARGRGTTVTVALRSVAVATP